MGKDQPEVAGVVVPFTGVLRLPVYLTALDRLELSAWYEPACEAGYDRMNIHECEGNSDGEYGDFVCLHRRGEAWSRWGFARKGASINVWCCLTGADFGAYSSMTAAFAAVLPGMTVKTIPTDSFPSVVTDLTPRLLRSASRLGSAA